jgi:hypothetical protein
MFSFTGRKVNVTITGHKYPSATEKYKQVNIEAKNSNIGLSTNEINILYLKLQSIVMSKEESLIPDEVVINKILVIRDRKVMIDADLAELYGVPTKRLNEQVKRNTKRFPEDFMFQLTEEEKSDVVAKCDHLKKLKFSPNLPYVFTEHGAVMLASVLNSDRAIEVNLQIVRIFVKMREMLLTHKDILLKLDKVEKKLMDHDEELRLIFKYLKELLDPPHLPREQIGFKTGNNKK